MRPFRPALLLALLVLAPSLAAAQAGTEVRLDSVAWQALNVFFSNFAEAEVPPFRRGEVPHLTLVRFGVMHHLANHSLWERIDNTFSQMGYGRLRASDVGAAVTRYFGVRLPHRAWPAGDDDRVAYADGYYVFPQADYPGFPSAQVLRLVDVGDGEFVATVGIYDELEEGEGAPTFEQLQERSGEYFYPGPAMRARIRRVSEGGRERYVLLEYLDAP